MPETTDLTQAAIGTVVVIAVAFAYQRSRLGRSLRATREDAAAAQAVGIDVHRQRLWAFTLSGALAGLAGGLYVHMLGSITADQVYLELTFVTLAMLVIGGVTSLWGAVVGALAVSGLDSFLSEAEQGVGVGFTIDLPQGARLVVLGALMALVLVLRPSGITGGREFRLPRLAPGGEVSRGRDVGGSCMRICVVGCGAVGSLFAANLATLDDVEVWAFDLNQAHVDAIKRERSATDRAPGRSMGHPRATSDPAELPPCDFGIVATKAMHAGAAIAATAHAFADGAVASVMNGVGNEETLAAHVERVIRGTTFPAGKLLEPGVVQWDVKGDTTFGPFEPRPIPRRRRSSRSPTPARARACRRRRSRDARPGQWRKVIFNAATNPMGALTGLTHGRVCERPDLRALVSGLVDEGKAVAAAQGITLDADPEELIDHAARPDVAYGHKASMLQDVEARRADRDRLPERRHRALRARARRPDAAPRHHHRAHQGG